jgi:hypothetical protein
MALPSRSHSGASSFAVNNCSLAVPLVQNPELVLVPDDAEPPLALLSGPI